LVQELSALARARGALLFTQNGDEFALSLSPLLDGWNREDVTFGYDFAKGAYVRIPPSDHENALEAIAAMRQAGVLVTTTDYVKTPGSSEEGRAVAVAIDAGALPYVSDIELERIPNDPFMRGPD
jgi:endo-alpha-1,4-polygalactosaminidase (GH114 family)